MDHESLRTASSYLNNLLLARGLLRNGEPIDFVKPSKESRASIINLVHDLILREDRDKEQREHVAVTLRQLRSEDARKTHDIERLQAKSEESARAAVQARQAERVANAEVKKVEKAMKALQDQTAKLKTTLAQVKTQCQNDVKKRDLELARLKTHLQGQQRGTRVGMTAPSMTVRKPMAESAPDLDDPAYSLKQETTEFLTKLSQELSDENDGLIGLIRNALEVLHEVLGLTASGKKPDSAIGSIHSNDEANTKVKNASGMLEVPPTSYEALAADLESTLEHLKTVLTNPNFVPLEEVEEREEEIVRLREGWEHMEGRWKDVLEMMHGWVKRMNTGDTINIDDLRKGMGLVTPSRRAKSKSKSQRQIEPEPEPEQEPNSSLMDSETSEIRLSNANGASKMAPAAPAPRQKSSLSASDGMNNLSDRLERLDSPKRKRDVIEPPEFFDLRPSTGGANSSNRRSAPPSPPKHASAPSPQPVLADEDESEELEIPQMTIADKLSAAQEEAEQAAAARANGTARASASSRRERTSRPTSAMGLDGAADELTDEDTLGKMPGDDTLGKISSPMAKRTKIRGRPKKRKSTLSPEELETLLCADD